MIVAFMTDADLYREAVKRSPDYWERGWQGLVILQKE
jgi:hypothetical protein